MTTASENRRVADLSPRKPNRFSLVPDAAACAMIAQALAISDLRKLRFEGEITSQGRHDWRLEGMLGATVVQPCVATLAPVTTRIDRPVARTYLAEGPPDPQGDEVEMPEDDTIEALPESIDLMALVREELALALPDYPRAADAAPVAAAVAPAGTAPLTDDDTRPFAALSGLRDKLGTGRKDGGDS